MRFVTKPEAGYTNASRSIVPFGRTLRAALVTQRRRSGDSDPMMLDQGTRLGHYEVISPLGKGGMGEVYLAEDVRLGRRVALKVLPAAFADDQGSLSRFIGEAKAASALNHPNIITIHDIGDAAGTHYIAYPLVDRQPARGRRAVAIAIAWPPSAGPTRRGVQARGWRGPRRVWRSQRRRRRPTAPRC